MRPAEKSPLLPFLRGQRGTDSRHLRLASEGRAACDFGWLLRRFMPRGVLKVRSLLHMRGAVKIGRLSSFRTLNRPQYRRIVVRDLRFQLKIGAKGRPRQLGDQVLVSMKPLSASPLLPWEGSWAPLQGDSGPNIAVEKRLIGGACNNPWRPPQEPETPEVDNAVSGISDWLAVGFASTTFSGRCGRGATSVRGATLQVTRA